MRDIHKGAEPPSLTQYRKEPRNTSYASYRSRQELREYLVKEQRGLCCYCQSRIYDDWGAMKIEHWQSISKHRGRQLDYSNMLGACLGGQGKPPAYQHCDTHKGNQELRRLHPADPNRPVEPHIWFSADGRISSDDPEVRRELCDILNLNTPQLVANRRGVLEGLSTGVSMRSRKGKRKLNPGRALRKWDGSQPGPLQPYSQVAVHWLQRKLRRPA